MNKKEAKKRIIEYLTTHNIPWKFLSEEQGAQNINSIDSIYFSASVPEVISGQIETVLRFRDEHVYCQSYYCQPIVEQNEEQIFRASRIINYINTHLSYEFDTMYEHTLALREEDGDVYNGTLIRYELLQQYFYDTMSYILDFQVQFLKDICFPVIGYTVKRLSFHQAAHVYIDKHLIGAEK